MAQVGELSGNLENPYVQNFVKDQVLTYPRISSCCALVLKTISGDLIGAHLTIADNRRIKTKGGIIDAINNKFRNPIINKIYFVGALTGNWNVSNLITTFKEIHLLPVEGQFYAKGSGNFQHAEIYYANTSDLGEGDLTATSHSGSVQLQFKTTKDGKVHELNGPGRLKKFF